MERESEQKLARFLWDQTPNFSFFSPLFLQSQVIEDQPLEHFIRAPSSSFQSSCNIKNSPSMSKQMHQKLADR